MSLTKSQIEYLIEHNFKPKDGNSSPLCCRRLAQFKNPIPLRQVGIRVGPALSRQRAVRSPHVHKRLHRLNVLGLEEVQSGGRENEVRKARVELLLQVEMVKRLDKVVPVEVGVDAEHLQEDGATDAGKLLGES